MNHESEKDPQAGRTILTWHGGIRAGKCAYADLQAENTRLRQELEQARGMVARVAASENNEATMYPYWGVVKNSPSGHPVMLAGVFFSRENAQVHLEARRYGYGKKAYVYCFSGHHSLEYRQLYDASKALQQPGGGE